MSVFEFTTVLFGFVVALGLARVLGGVADLVRSWRQLVDPILFSFWFTLLVLFPIAWWTSLWRASEATNFNLVQLLLMFHVPVFIFIATRLLVPPESEFAKIDERYDVIRTPFAICIATPVFFAPLLGLFTGISEMIYLVAMGLLQFSLPFVKSRRYDYFVAGASVVIYIAFMVQYRAVIGEL